MIRIFSKIAAIGIYRHLLTLEMRSTCLVLGILSIYVPAWGSTYYVDAKGGNDRNSGTATDNAWKTIAKVNISSFSAGDSILYKKGETWREQMLVSSSGSAGSPITFGVYGTGANPVINGSDVVTGWSLVNEPNKWKAAVITEPRVVVVNNTTRGNKKTSIATLTVANDWYWESNFLYFYKSTDPGITVEAGKRDYGIAVVSSPRSYLTFQDIDVKKTNYYGFSHNVLGTSSNITVRRSAFSYSGNSGIYFYQQHGTQKTTDITIDNNTVYENGTNGIDISAGTNNVTVKNNIVHHNNWATDQFTCGIHFFSAGDGDNILVDNNTVYSNYAGNVLFWSSGCGIWLDSVGFNSVVRYNRVYDNKKVGIFVENTSGSQIYYNIVYNNGTTTTAGFIDAGIYVYRLKGGVKVYNNVAYRNLVGIALRGEDASDRGMVGHVVRNNISIGNTFQQFVATFGAENDNVMGSGNIYSNNNFGPEGNHFIEWGNGVFKDTYDAWETAYGGTTNSVKADPKFTSMVPLDFRLQSTSPAIDAGTNVFLTTDYDGNPVPFGSAPDIGAFEYQVITRKPLSPSGLIIN